MKTYQEFLENKGEAKWQAYWEKKKTFQAIDGDAKEKFYSLVEFPYPSGAGLHVGHPRPYTAMDVISRKKRMEGKNVLYPIGFDAFGLPTENYAIKTGRPPQEVTKKNIANFTRQIKSLGFSFDWDRVVDTTDPQYFKWTQWLFLKFFEHGLAYKKEMPINWCLNCKIGLANEEVVDGKCERCGGVVEKRNKSQWMLKITNYAEQLLEGLKNVDYIPPARTQQENWIGKSEGARIKFAVIGCHPERSEGSVKEHKDSSPAVQNDNCGLEVFTTRPDTLFGATYMVVAPEHNIIEDLKLKIENIDQVEKYIKQAKLKSDLERTELQKEKTGVELKGIKAINPATKKEIPIFVADYVLASYGTGAIMAVPAHDERDFEFAKKYNLEIKEVIFNSELSNCHSKQSEACLSGRQESRSFANAQDDKNDECFCGEGTVVNSDFLNCLSTKEAKDKMIEWLEKNKIGKKEINYKLRDWVFSRQRYWGEPIPLVYCENCGEQVKSGKLKVKSSGEKLNPGWVPLTEKDLPLELPKVEKYEPTDTGESPLAGITKWVNTKCPRCGGPAKRETDTMPNWAGSSWYFLRYLDPKNTKEFCSSKKLKYWMPVDWYNGGMEHTVLHLLYSRFWNLFMYDIGLLPNPEPYQKRTSHGMILASDGEKMSKSRGNVINPDEMVEKFGADAVRTYIMFMGPFDQAVAWSTDGLKGVKRFLDKVWKLQDKLEVSQKSKIKNQKLDNLLNKTIKKVGEDIEEMKFNTAIATMMELVNELQKQDKILATHYSLLIKILSPFVPHMCEELWAQLGNKKSITFESWPKYDESKIIEEKITLAIQINGKLRDTLEVEAGIEESDVKKRVLSLEKVQKYLDGKEPKKVIYVKGKLVSVVV